MSHSHASCRSLACAHPHACVDERVYACSPRHPQAVHQDDANEEHAEMLRELSHTPQGDEQADDEGFGGGDGSSVTAGIGGCGGAGAGVEAGAAAAPLRESSYEPPWGAPRSPSIRLSGVHHSPSPSTRIAFSPD